MTRGARARDEKERPAVPEAGEERPSKTKRKREALALQSLGETLMGLSGSELASVPLPEDVREALRAGRGLRRGAYRRHVRYLARLLRESDAEPVRRAVEALEHASAEDKARARRLERWRERLLAEGDAAVEELLDAWPRCDRQRLRQLVRLARDDAHPDKARRAYRELLRFLRELGEPGE